MPTTKEPALKVVMVHGILDNGRNFTLLRNYLEKRNIACFVPKLKPSDGRTGLDVLALQLKEKIDAELGPDQKFALLGYSMGGLVGRHYLQNLGGAQRCEQLITFCSPHNGTMTARLYPGKGTYQMRRGSRFLADLAETQEALGDMPVTSYRTPLDLVIIPSTSSVWQRADNRTHWAPLHPMILWLPSVMSDVEKRLLDRNMITRNDDGIKNSVVTKP